jgi:outer membrane protein TolC
MKLIQPITLFILIFNAVHAFGQDSLDHQFSLDECLEYALKNNENIIIANLEVDASRAKTGEFMSAGFPQVDVNASLNKNFILRRTFLPANQFDPTAPEDEVIELVFGTPYDSDVGISINQMVFNGSYFVGLKASKIFQELSTKEHIKSKIDVIESVTKAYYTVMVNQLTYETVLANYQRLDSLMQDTKVMYENGFAEQLEYNRIRVEFNNIRTSRTNALRNIAISTMLLKFQMGMPMEEQLAITDKLSDLAFNVREELDMNYSYQRRIEYSILETNRLLTEMDMKNNRSQYLPKLDLFFSWGMNAGVREFSKLGELSNRMVWPDYQLAGLTLNIPIFDGLYKAKLIQQNKIKLNQLDYQRQMIENSIKMEVNQFRQTLQNNLGQLNAQEENMELAESVYRQARIKYEEGVGSNLEIIDADNSFKQAQSNYFTALYDALISHVDYQKALGILKIDY